MPQYLRQGLKYPAQLHPLPAPEPLRSHCADTPRSPQPFLWAALLPKPLAAEAAARKAAAEEEARQEAARQAAAEEAARQAAEAERQAEEEARRAAEEEARRQAEEEEARRQAEEEEEEEESYSSGSSSGYGIVDYADQFVGCPYVWGGNSLTNGCDCSHFVYNVLKNCGVYSGDYLTSGEWAYVGRSVSSLSSAQAGDIIVYSGHVAIYDGDGCIVEAKGSQWGITHDRSATCKSIVAIRRFT